MFTACLVTVAKHQELQRIWRLFPGSKQIKYSCTGMGFLFSVKKKFYSKREDILGIQIICRWFQKVQNIVAFGYVCWKFDQSLQTEHKIEAGQTRLHPAAVYLIRVSSPLAGYACNEVQNNTLWAMFFLGQKIWHGASSSSSCGQKMTSLLRKKEHEGTYFSDLHSFGFPYSDDRSCSLFWEAESDSQFSPCNNRLWTEVSSRPLLWCGSFQKLSFLKKKQNRSHIPGNFLHTQQNWLTTACCSILTWQKWNDSLRRIVGPRFFRKFVQQLVLQLEIPSVVPKPANWPVLIHPQMTRNPAENVEGSKNDTHDKRAALLPMLKKLAVTRECVSLQTQVNKPSPLCYSQLTWSSKKLL